MNIVIPMAGKGDRFKKIGIYTPKPLINVIDRPMFYWALDSFQNQFLNPNFIFICLKDDIEKFPIEEAMYNYVPDAKLVVIDSLTSGQAETVLYSEPYLNIKEPLLIYNCDTYLQSNISRSIKQLGNEIDGLIFVSPSSDQAFSYVILDENNEHVVGIEEKKVVSKLASTGLYHFTNPLTYIDAAEDYLLKNINNEKEYYISSIYNYLISKGLKFKPDLVNTFFPLGTPNQLASSMKKLLEKKIQVNNHFI